LISNPDAAEWDALLAARGHPPSLLQSWGYGQVQQDEGWRVQRVDLGSMAASVLLRGPGPHPWGYVPRGPVPASREALSALVEWARDRHLSGISVEPEAGEELIPTLQGLGFGPAAELHPRTTLLVPLAEEDAMLSQLKPKHRYNLRLALRKGVEVEAGDDAHELHRQSVQTGVRQGISVPALAAYQRRLRWLAWCRIYVARFEGEALGAIMVARFAGRAYYLFGGSSVSRRELMPSYALQWRAMLDARAAGCVDYDLWGSPPGPDPDHRWAGLWQFKSGFGGQLVNYCGAWEMTLDASAARLLRTVEPLSRLAARLRRRIG